MMISTFGILVYIKIFLLFKGYRVNNIVFIINNMHKLEKSFNPPNT